MFAQHFMILVLKCLYKLMDLAWLAKILKLAKINILMIIY